MIYLVTKQQKLFEDDAYKVISAEEALSMISTWKIIQVDTETSGRNAHINDFLCVQFGNDKADAQIVVDTSTIDVKLFKEPLEENLCILQNAKFDLQFFFNYGIIMRHIYDTMIVEQLLHLGYPAGQISYSLKEIAWRRLSINIDKTVRGEIIWRGLDKSVILYSAGDVMYLEKIMWLQVEDLKKQGLLKAAKLECDFLPAISYLEWCGIHLDADKWKAKMVKDKAHLNKAKEDLDAFIVSMYKGDNTIADETKDVSSGDGWHTALHPTKHSFASFVKIDLQGDLFSGFNTEPQCTINWSSSRQVVNVAKLLGFDTTVQDKKTGEDKDSVLEKHLKGQKGINDEFLNLYFSYQEYAKVVSSFGQGHLNAINPNTGRIHTVFKQLGAASGRMSCGSQQPNTELAKLNNVSPKECTSPNIQQLPADEETRAAFTAEEGNLLADCDYSALESRLGADIYNEQEMINEFLYGSGDIHSLMAQTFFRDEIGDVSTKDIKKLFPQLRKKAKSPEFLLQFGGSAMGLAKQLGCPLEEAQGYENSYYGRFTGIAEFKAKGSSFVRKHGYVLMCPITGHKMYWWDHSRWLDRQKSFTQDFWEEYRTKHKGTGDLIAQEVKQHFQAASKWDRMALNAPTQGTGCIIIKTAATDLFNWIVDNNYFNIIKLCAMVHDELLVEFPETMKETFPKTLEKIMFDAAAKYCSKVPIPAEAEVSTHWVH